MKVKGQSQSGFGMVEAMVAVGLFGIFVLALETYLSQSDLLDRSYEARQNSELIRQYVRNNLNCAETFKSLTPSMCGVPNRYINAIAMDGSIVASSDQKSKIGFYGIRVSCPIDTHSLSVETLRTVGKENGEKTALTHLTKETETWSDLFHGIPAYTESPRPTLLNFESIPGAAAGLALDSPQMIDYLKSVYGIWFTSVKGGGLVLAKITQSGDPEPPKARWAWYSAKCPDKPNHNRLCEGGDGGQFIMTTKNAVNTKNIVFDIHYAAPTQQLTFQLADFDGLEAWTFTLYDKFNNVIKKSHFNAAKGYGKGTENNSLQAITLTSPSVNIDHVRAQGHKGISTFGFGFDNFEPGIPPCLGW